MKTLFLALSVLALSAASSLGGESKIAVGDRIEIGSISWRALLVALKHLQGREDYTAEQRKPENYKVWIQPEKDEIEVSFLALCRPDDTESKGGNYVYARSTTYVISATNFNILKVYGSR